MCRFTAVLSKKKIQLKSLLNDPKNSLVNQSYSAQEGHSGINGDGFGLAWYNFDLGSEPGVFKSVLPAWNDENLLNLSSKIHSQCFVGHVRASTVGTVNYANCHPFSFHDLLFAHNGTIRNFDEIKKEIIQLLPAEILKNVKGQTDSEYLFALISHYFSESSLEISLERAVLALKQAIEKVNNLQTSKGVELHSRLNLVLTNGKYLISTRYSSKEEDVSLTLYYKKDEKAGYLSSCVVSSEILELADSKEWVEVPENHILTLNEEMKFSLKPLVLNGVVA